MTETDNRIVNLREVKGEGKEERRNDNVRSLLQLEVLFD